MFTIYPVDKTQSIHIKKRIDNKTKPIGALGQLEPLAEQLALIQQSDTLTVDSPHLLIFAADHSISQHGISIVPAEVTTQMIQNFLAGGAAANCFCRSNNMALKIVDAGILGDVDDHPDLIKQPLGKGTQDFTTQDAMSLDTVQQAISAGASVVDSLHQSGTNLVAFGEMGIGNTSSAAAIMALLLNLPADACTGHGTGINDSQYQKKLALIRLACKYHYSATGDPLKVLSAVGGFEITQITGGILQAAENRMIVLVDGFIVTAAALLAVAINPNVIDYLVFCHHSEEAGHHRMLQHLNASPLLNLGLRLGEGTGAVLALPLIKAACAFYNDMASRSYCVSSEHQSKASLTDSGYRYQWQLFFVALAFFTRIPIPTNTPFSTERLNHANRYFGVIGIIVGAICSLIYLLFILLFPPTIAIGIAIISGLLITGAFHEDGLADVFDGFGGGWTVESKPI